MIKSFRCRETEGLFARTRSRKLPGNLQRAMFKKLLMLDQAIDIQDLRSPPSNHLEKLSGKRQGQYSIRINRQWRLCFHWTGSNATDVEIVDYH